ncbi:MAG: hypothetical protein IKL00_11270, partial [Oscillospiraceae bacterium]|nr:hypothetical protein [Oscillospiraceae bacterium]
TTTEATTTTTTTEATTTAPPQSQTSVVLKDVVYGESYSLNGCDYNSIDEIIIQLDGNVGYGFGGCLVMGYWETQNAYSHSDLNADNTIRFKITNPKSAMTIYNYWGNMKLVSVTLVFK